MHMICWIVCLDELFTLEAFPCMILYIIMTFSLMQECYKRLTTVTYHIMLICHFCHIWCVHRMSLRSTCVLNYNMPYLQRCLSCVFVIYVVTSTSMQSSLFPVVILMPCKHDATVRSMRVLSCFSKDVLNMWLCFIYPWPCLQLWSALECLVLALLLL